MIFNVLTILNIGLYSIFNFIQNTNFYISHSQSHQTHISSLQGPITYNGLIYQFPFQQDKNHLGDNIQSNFFEDSSGDIWYSTYEALHRQDKVSETLSWLQFKDVHGEVISSDYRIHLIRNDTLFLKAGDYFLCYDARTKKELSRWHLNIRNSYQAAIVQKKEGDILFYEVSDTLFWIPLLKDYCIPEYFVFHSSISDIKSIDEHRLLITNSKGEMIEWNTDACLVKDIHGLSKNRIVGFCFWKCCEVIVSDARKLLFYDYNQRKVVDSLFLYTQDDCKLPLNKLIRPYIDSDSILWIGSDGYGIIHYDLKPKKINYTFPEGSSSNLVGVHPWNETEYYTVARDGSVALFNINTKEYKTLWNVADQHVAGFSVKWSYMDQNSIYIAAWNKLFVYHISNNQLIEMKAMREALDGFYEIKKSPNGKVYAISTRGVVEISFSANEYSWKKIKGWQDRPKPFTLFDFDSNGNLYASYNQETIMFYRYLGNDAFQLEHEFPLSGDVKCIATGNKEHYVYLCNNIGLYELNIHDFSVTTIKDKNQNLSQVLYAIVPDEQQNLWLSSNSGILRYSLIDSSSHLFRKKDGLQGTEFNTNAYCKTEKGLIFMAGINGLNYFDPKSVKLSTKKAPVDIYSFKINNKEAKQYGAPNVLDSLNLNYKDNTLTFEFLAIDYHDPKATQVKYRLLNLEPEFTLSDKVETEVRYTDLNPGHYTLQIMSANADGVWCHDLRTIDITINPPFWQTWWFRMLILFSGLYVYYKINQSYYKRKLEKKDLLLREQRLIIEKQEAINLERSRIAAEMHDDLGSGLTTIRYLSDRGLKFVTNETDKINIQKIAQQSNDLIRNMSEIIWAMNSRFDTLEGLIAYIRHYASEFLEEYKVQLDWTYEGSHTDLIVSGEKRRNIFLVIKEIIHNVVKHSQATKVNINIKEINQQVTIEIQDNGIGFKLTNSKDIGNGLHNMHKRMSRIDGTISISSTKGSGTKNTIIFQVVSKGNNN